MAGPKLTSTQLRNFIATTQGKSYTVGAVTILLVLVIFLAGVFPALSSIFFQINQNGVRMDALNQIETKRQTLRTLSADEQAKRAITLSLNANLPDTLDQKAIFETVNQMIKDSGTKLIAMTFSNLDSRRDFVVLFQAGQQFDGKVVNLSFQGERSAVEAMVSQLENSRRIFNITSLSLLRNIETNAAETVTILPFRADLQMEVYFWNKTKGQ